MFVTRCNVSGLRFSSPSAAADFGVFAGRRLAGVSGAGLMGLGDFGVIGALIEDIHLLLGVKGVIDGCSEGLGLGVVRIAAIRRLVGVNVDDIRAA